MNIAAHQTTPLPLLVQHRPRPAPWSQSANGGRASARRLLIAHLFVSTQTALRLYRAAIGQALIKQLLMGLRFALRCTTI